MTDANLDDFPQTQADYIAAHHDEWLLVELQEFEDRRFEKAPLPEWAWTS